MEVSIEIRNFNLDAPSTRRRWGFGNPSTEGGNEGKCWCEEVEGGRKEVKRHSICFCAKKWQVGFAALDGTLARSGCKMDRVICCHILSKNEDKSASPVLCCTEVTQESTWPTSLHS